MKFTTYSHRYADIIINSDYSIRQELEEIIKSIDIDGLKDRFKQDNDDLISRGKKPKKRYATFTK